MSLISDIGSSVLVMDKKILQTIEDHLVFIMNGGVFNRHNIEPNIASKYVGDFYGLLSYLKIDPLLHYVTLRLSGYNNSSEYSGGINHIFTPDVNIVINILSVHNINRI